MQEYEPESIGNREYQMRLDNIVNVNGIDRLYITPSECVEKVELDIAGYPITITQPRISNRENLDGKVTFWKNWYLSKTNSILNVIKITMKDENTIPIIRYRAKTTGCRLRWKKYVNISGQDWTPAPLVNTPYNNILVYDGGMMVLQYAR